MLIVIIALVYVNCYINIRFLIVILTLVYVNCYNNVNVC